jgi:hypothetical protein
MSDIEMFARSLSLSHLLDERIVKEVRALQSHEMAVSWQRPIRLQSVPTFFMVPSRQLRALTQKLAF